jgi:hypothetical protein
MPGDKITGKVGDGGRNISVGKGNEQHANENTNNVHVALNRIAEADESALRQMTALINTVADMKKAMIGDEEYDRPGIIEQIQEMHASDQRRERWHVIDSGILVVMMVGQVAHTIALIYLFRWIWGI